MEQRCWSTPSWGDWNSAQNQTGRNQALTSSVSAGLIGNEKDGDSSLSISFTGNSRYQDEQQKLSLSGSFNASKSKDSGEPLSIDTEKGSAQVRYDKPIGSNLDLFALSSYQFNGTNDSGVYRLANIVAFH